MATFRMWTMYDSVVLVPLIFWSKNLDVRTGQRDELRDAVYAELARDHIQTGSEFILMRRNRKWKIVFNTNLTLA